jgi:hypothetical protein
MSPADIMNVVFFALFLWFFILVPVAWVRVFNAPISSREKMAWTFALFALFPLGTIAVLLMVPHPADHATQLSKTKRTIDDAISGPPGSAGT